MFKSVQDLKTYPRTGGKSTPETALRRYHYALVVRQRYGWRVSRQQATALPLGKRGEPGNLRNQDIKTAMS